MATFNTTRLVQQVKLKGSLPEGRFEDDEILDLATDVLTSEVAPLMVSIREEYYVRSKDYTVTAGQSEYLMPARAIGAVLREVKLVSGTEIYDLTRIDPEDISSTSSGELEGFYLKGDNIVLYPTPSGTGDTLQVTYFCRPNALVATTECGQITNISGSTLTVTVPTGWTTANTFDLIRGESGYGIKAIDLTASAVNAGSIVLTNAVPSDIVVGDWICLAGESCFPWLPADAHQLLVHLTVVACLESMGDQTNLPIAVDRAQALRTALEAVLNTRIQGAPRRFTTSLL